MIKNRIFALALGLGILLTGFQAQSKELPKSVNASLENKEVLLKAESPAPVKEAASIELPGKAGKFDFMAVDSEKHILLAAHKGAKTLEVFSLDSEKLLAAVPVGEAQGVAVDSADHLYLVGNGEEKSVSIIDSNTLQSKAEVKLTGPVDAIAFNSRNGLLYAAEDDGDKLWMIDPRTAKLQYTISIPGVPEGVVYDGVADKIYVNIRSRNLLVKIDPLEKKITETFETKAASDPHGLAIDTQNSIAYVAGVTGTLVAINLKTGKIVSTVPISLANDQLALDSRRHRIFVACRGVMNVVSLSGTSMQNLGSLILPKGTHSITLDPKSGDAWIANTSDTHSYLKKYQFSRRR